MNIPRRPLNDGNLPDDIVTAYDAVNDLEPVPLGKYRAVAITGDLRKTTNGKWYYRVTWEITEGEHTGRRVSRMYFLTPEAMEYTIKALKKLGIDRGEKLNEPFPAGRFVCDIQVTVREFNGEPVNEVKSFVVVEKVEPEPDPFAPLTADGGPTGD